MKSNLVLRVTVLFGFLVCVGCSDDGDEPDLSGPAPFRAAGPYAAGVRTLTVASREVEVWYPAEQDDVEGLEPYVYFIRDALAPRLEAVLDPDINPPFVTNAFRDVAASDDGPFPLVIFAHGALSYRNQSTFLTSHLATWGFVVASVDYLERGLFGLLGDEPEVPFDDDSVLTREVVNLMSEENARAGGALEGRIGMESIAITGHSAGGRTAREFGDEPEVITYIPLSAGIREDFEGDLPGVPSLWLTGVDDGIVSVEGIERAFAAAATPTRMVLIEEMGHLGPSDICAIGAGGGGVVGIALEAGFALSEGVIRLGTDGCGEEAIAPEAGWPTVNHFVTAHLRWAFGIDQEPVGLSQSAQDDLPETTFTYEERL